MSLISTNQLQTVGTSKRPWCYSKPREGSRHVATNVAKVARLLLNHALDDELVGPSQSQPRLMIELPPGAPLKNFWDGQIISNNSLPQ